MKSKLKDAIFGLAVADALGVPVEFRKRGTFKIEGVTGYGTYNQPEGTWSDDTSMTIASCDSIRECGRIDLQDMLEKFRSWLYDAEYTPFGNVFDVGNTTAYALRRGAGDDDWHANGNGSLMRILPLAFTDATTEEIEAVSAITHAHHISKLACVIYVNIARSLLKGVDLKNIIRRLCLEEPFHRVHSIYSLQEDTIKSSGFVVDTFEAALWCLATTDNYKDAVLKAINLGEDTDTVAAVTGGLAGIMYGYDSIPTEWLDALKSKDIIEKCLF